MAALVARALTARLSRRAQAARHLGTFASFELFDDDGPVGIDLHCSRRSPSKLTVSFNLSERILLGQTPHAATMKVCSLDQQPLSIKIKSVQARGHSASGYCSEWKQNATACVRTLPWYIYYINSAPSVGWVGGE